MSSSDSYWKDGWPVSLTSALTLNGNTLEPHERFLKYRVLLFLRAPIVTIIFSIKHPVRIWCFSLYVLSWWFLICRTSYAIQLRTWDLSHLLLLLLMYLFIRFDSWDAWFTFHQVKYSNVYQSPTRKKFEFHENPSKKNYWIKTVSWWGDFLLLIKRVFWKPQFINPRRVNEWGGHTVINKCSESVLRNIWLWLCCF